VEITEIIRRGIVTEKSVDLQNKANQYSFEVALKANKIEIKRAVEAMFPSVTVLRVNTMRMPGKTRRVYSLRRRRAPQVAEARPWKKAIVTLAEGQVIAELQA
jgi:large subunit ribosomal protein L23